MALICVIIIEAWGYVTRANGKCDVAATRQENEGAADTALVSLRLSIQFFTLLFFEKCFFEATVYVARIKV